MTVRCSPRRSTLRRLGATVVEVDRGGLATYHGPGQLVGYPILDLRPRNRDVHRYLRDLEQALIDTLQECAIPAQRIEKKTGVWVGDRKIASIGVRFSRWISSHGFALNVTTDLSYFSHIVPCGMPTVTMTSVAQDDVCCTGGRHSRHGLAPRAHRAPPGAGLRASVPGRLSTHAVRHACGSSRR